MFDDFSRAPVTGAANLRPWWWMFMIEIGVVICIPLLVIGGLATYALPFPQAVLAVVLSSLILCLLSTITCIVGTRTRLTTLLIAEGSLGRLPARLLSLFVLIGFLGWWGFQTEIMAQTADVIAAHAGWVIPRWLLIGVTGLIMISTSVIGSRAIGKVAYVLVPIKLLVIAILLWHVRHALSLTGIVAFVPPVSGQQSFGTILGTLIGGMVVAVLEYPDISRFLRTQKDAVIAGITMFSGLTAIYLVGIVLSIAYATNNLVQVLPTLGYAPLALLIVFFATWAANDKNLYAATLGIAAFAPGNLPRWLITAIAGFVGIALAYIGIFNHLVAILTLLGVVLAPVAGIYASDFFLNPHRYTHPTTQTIRLIPTTIWALGTLTGLLTTPASGFGFGVLTISTVPTLDALFVAVACMLLAYGTGLAEPEATPVTPRKPRKK